MTRTSLYHKYPSGVLFTVTGYLSWQLVKEKVAQEEGTSSHRARGWYFSPEVSGCDDGAPRLAPWSPQLEGGPGSFCFFFL